MSSTLRSNPSSPPPPPPANASQVNIHNCCQAMISVFRAETRAPIGARTGTDFVGIFSIKTVSKRTRYAKRSIGRKEEHGNVHTGGSDDDCVNRSCVRVRVEWIAGTRAAFTISFEQGQLDRHRMPPSLPLPRGLPKRNRHAYTGITAAAPAEETVSRAVQQELCGSAAPRGEILSVRDENKFRGRFRRGTTGQSRTGSLADGDLTTVTTTTINITCLSDHNTIVAYCTRTFCRPPCQYVDEYHVQRLTQSYGAVPGSFVHGVLKNDMSEKMFKKKKCQHRTAAMIGFRYGSNVFTHDSYEFTVIVL